MKILHTADWHLGKKLEQYERTEEHQEFLNWLIQKLIDERIDVLIIAGDIFDTGAPSNTALEQYYRFLRSVKNTCCREVIIIGGNHDSISTLNAPKELLKYFDVHIVGGVPDNFTDQIIFIKDKDGKIELVVCAVPFLRDRDIRLSISGETSEERETRIKKGIGEHYQKFIEYISLYRADGVPVIATGHLFAAGSSTSESEKDIHVGNLGQIGGDQFPVEFDYIALGHIHRPQLVNKLEHIRYSGSPIPLSFSESDHYKQIVICEFSAGRPVIVTEHRVPAYRHLLRIKGTLESVKSQIMLIPDRQAKFASWVEVQVETDAFVPDLNEQLDKLKKDKPSIERFFPRQCKIKAAVAIDSLIDVFTLVDLEPKAVFLKKCVAEFGDADYADLVSTFEEALEQLNQREDIQ